MTDVLLLNASYEPLRLLSAAEALLLLLRGKAEVVEWSDRVIASASGQHPVPLVLRVSRYIAWRSRRLPSPSRKAVLERDGHTCQYCGRALPASQLTLDHVLPRAQGGQSTWENLVAACRDCNGYKAARTPAQAGMQLLSTPRVPRPTSRPLAHPAWARYGYGAA